MGIEIKKLKPLAWHTIINNSNVYFSAVNTQQAKSKIMKKFAIPYKNIIVERAPELDNDVDIIESNSITITKIKLNKIIETTLVCPHCGKNVEELFSVYLKSRNKE